MSTIKTIHERPRMGPYMGMSLPFLLILCLYLTIFLTKPNVSVGFPITVCALVAILSALWIYGHRITINGNNFIYRDGFYRKTFISTETIRSITIGNYSFRNLGNAVKIPSVVIKYDNSTLSINPVIFRPGLTKRLTKAIGENKNSNDLISHQV